MFADGPSRLQTGQSVGGRPICQRERLQTGRVARWAGTYTVLIRFLVCRLHARQLHTVWYYYFSFLQNNCGKEWLAYNSKNKLKLMTTRSAVMTYRSHDKRLLAGLDNGTRNLHVHMVERIQWVCSLDHTRCTVCRCTRYGEHTGKRMLWKDSPHNKACSHENN